MTVARLPTPEAEFRLALYRGGDGKDHLALVLGEVESRERVLVRIHSECFTGDVLGSNRCDCGEQLHRSMALIAEEGTGVLLYLRQEGRGIGLLQKLRAYNLQDAGYDTVEANLELGHQADERQYDVAVAILRDLGVGSIRLLTNNPTKLEGLIEHGFTDVERMPIEIAATPENAGYLETKVRRMRHLLELDSFVTPPGVSEEAQRVGPLDVFPRRDRRDRPAITLAWAQSLDGSITFERGKVMTLSSPEALELTHGLRSRHSGILVGIDTVLADDPRLTVRLVEGEHPRPIVLDSRLRMPLEAALLEAEPKPWIATTHGADPERQRRLEALGADVIRVPADADGRVELGALLALLHERGLESIMVEGGAEVITSFLRAGVVDRVVVTVAPILVGGLSAVAALSSFPVLSRPRYRWLGNNLILTGDVDAEPSDPEIDDEMLVGGGLL